MFAVLPVPLCFIQCTSSEGEEGVVYEATLEKTAAVILGLIGIAFLATGLYLLIGRIGTIPAITGGTGLLMGGVAILSVALFLASRPRINN